MGFMVDALHGWRKEYKIEEWIEESGQRKIDRVDGGSTDGFLLQSGLIWSLLWWVDVVVACTPLSI